MIGIYKKKSKEEKERKKRKGNKGCEEQPSGPDSSLSFSPRKKVL